MPDVDVAEVALSLVLVVGAVLLVDSFRRLQKVDPVSAPKDIATFFVGLPPVHIRTSNARDLSFQNASKNQHDARHYQRLRGILAPCSRSGQHSFACRGRGPPASARKRSHNRGALDHFARFFETLDIPSRQGRDFDLA